MQAWTTAPGMRFAAARIRFAAALALAWTAAMSPLAAQSPTVRPPVDSASVSQPSAAHAPPARDDFAGFDDFVADVMEDWQVPGVAVGVIRDGEIVLARGYGHRDVERRLPVTEHTTMAIGSNSKSFTVTLMAMLVDEGALDWDTPVRDYLPDFRLYDEFATAEMTPRDLVTHQSGLPRHDNVWYGRADSREEIFRKLRFLEPNASFRSRYQYQNLMFLTAGYLVERLTGRGWDDLIDERIFTPLGMERSNTSVDDSPASGDHALPYTLRDGVLKQVPFRNIDNVGPAGSINSNVVEMLAYIEAHLEGGVQGGHRLISEESSAQMQQPQFAMPGDSEFAELGPVSYGLGLRVGTYRGRKIVLHGGGIDGFISSMSWLPREKMGVMVVTNRSGGLNPVPVMVAYNVYDRLLGLPEVDWNARNLDERAKQEARAVESEEEMLNRRVPGTSPTHPLAAYAGTYRHPGYGAMNVAVGPGSLTVGYDDFVLDLEHFHYDVFRITSVPNTVPVTGLVTFSTDRDGGVASVAIPFEPNGADIVFARTRMTPP